MVSGTETTTGNQADALETAEANKPPIYQALLNEMDAGTRAVVEAVGSNDVPDGDVSAPQHRSQSDAGTGEQRAPHNGAVSS